MIVIIFWDLWLLSASYWEGAFWQFTETYENSVPPNLQKFDVKIKFPMWELNLGSTSSMHTKNGRYRWQKNINGANARIAS